MAKTLVLFCPTIHRGYLDFLQNPKNVFSEIYLLDEGFGLSLGVNPPLNALQAETVRDFLENIIPSAGLIDVVKEDHESVLAGKHLVFVNDELSRAFVEKFFLKEKVEWVNLFLRWDRGRVHAEMPVGVTALNGEVERGFIVAAYKEAENSSDWWRQVGCLIVKDGKVLFKTYNKGCPDDHTPLAEGQVRDYMKAGEKPEFANFIHAEQLAIAQAAREGISLQGADMYITHFPCPVCAKSVAYSGVVRVYFAEGSSVVDAKTILEASGVKLFFVKKDEPNS